MPPDHDPEHWSNRPATIFIAGAAAVLLVGVLIVAVARTADDSSELPDTFVAPTTSMPSSAWTPSTTTTEDTPGARNRHRNGDFATASAVIAPEIG